MMAKPGPPKKPTAKKKLEGTYRKDRAPKNEPQPKVGAPPKPRYLDRDASHHWRYYAPKLVRDRVMTDMDWSQFINACECWGMIRRCRRAIKKHGLTFTGSNGYVTQRPEIGILNRALEQYQKYATRFGFDPSGRTGIEAFPEPGQDQADNEFLFGGPQGLKAI